MGNRHDDGYCYSCLCDGIGSHRQAARNLPLAFEACKARRPNGSFKPGIALAVEKLPAYALVKGMEVISLKRLRSESCATLIGPSFSIPLIA